MDSSSPPFVKQTVSICPIGRTVCPNGRILSQSIDSGIVSGYDDTIVKHLLNRYNKSRGFREEFSK